MTFQDFCSQYLLCPACHSRLTGSLCKNCRNSFRNNLDVLDLRWPRPDRPDPQEEKLISEMLRYYQSITFQELLELRFRNHLAPEELVDDYKNIRLTLQQRGLQMMQMFQRRLSINYAIPNDFLALDIGCGVGGASYALSRKFKWVVGFDQSLPDLLLARKYCEERYVQNVFLVQAYAQNIPLRDKCVSYSVAQNVIEHLLEVGPVFQEISRVLLKGGCFCGDSRNRFDLLFPEPHVKLRWVGFLPRKLQPWYVKKRRNLSYNNTYLLSLRELKRFARKTFGNSARTVFPLVSAYGKSAKFDLWIQRIEYVPILNSIMLLFFPSHLLIAQAE